MRRKRDKSFSSRDLNTTLIQFVKTPRTGFESSGITNLDLLVQNLCHNHSKLPHFFFQKPGGKSCWTIVSSSWISPNEDRTSPNDSKVPGPTPKIGLARKDHSNPLQLTKEVAGSDSVGLAKYLTT